MLCALRADLHARVVASYVSYYEPGVYRLRLLHFEKFVGSMLRTRVSMETVLTMRPKKSYIWVQ
jgi:hypothetical protein